MCVFLCTCVYIHMVVRKRHQVSSLCWQPLSFFQTGFRTSVHWWPFTSWPVNSRDLPVSPSQALFIHMCTVTSFVCVCWGSELSQVFILSWQVPHWAISPASISDFFKYHFDFIITAEDRFLFPFLKCPASYKAVALLSMVTFLQSHNFT